MTNQEEKKRFEIGLNLTKQCNARCSFCIWRKLDIDVSKKNELPFSKIKQFIEPIKNRFNIFCPLIGGEVALYSELEELINYLSENNIDYTFVSNSKNWELYKFIFENPVYLKNLDSISLSLDGNEEYHDSTRGAGSFQKLKEFLKYLKPFKKPVSIKTAYSPQNIKHIPFVLKFAKDNDIEAQFFSMIQSEEHLNVQKDFDKARIIFDKLVPFSDIVDKKVSFEIWPDVQKQLGPNYCPQIFLPELFLAPQGVFPCCNSIGYPEFKLGKLQEPFDFLWNKKINFGTQIFSKWISVQTDLNIEKITMRDKCSFCRQIMGSKFCLKNDVLAFYQK